MMGHRPKILVVNAITGGGGVTESFLTSLTMLRRSGIDPVALVPSNFLFLDRLKQAGLTVEQDDWLAAKGALLVPFQAARIARVAKRHGVDRILLNNGRFVNWLRRFSRQPVVTLYHGGKLGRVLASDRIITINEPQRQALVAAGYSPGSVDVIDNAYPHDSVPAFVSRAPNTPVRIGTLRLLEPAKGVDVLIRAAAILRKQGYAFLLEIGSSGSQLEALKSLAQESGLEGQVNFRGWIEDRDAFYAGLDLYVLPSRQEEWGIGIIEAWAASLPVVATACLGPLRLVADEETGLIVPVNDPEAMATALARCLDDATLRQRLAVNGHGEVARYTLPRIAERYGASVMGPLISARLPATK